MIGTDRQGNRGQDSHPTAGPKGSGRGPRSAALLRRRPLWALVVAVPLVVMTVSNPFRTSGPTASHAATAASKRVALPKYYSVAAALKAAAPAAATPKLKVLSALTSSAKNGPKSGDQVTQYKWLLNLDNTGSATSGKDIASCHPLNPDGSKNLNYPDGPSGVQAVAQPPLYGTSIYNAGTHTFTEPNPATAPCPWPSLHYETASPVISEGDQSNWGDALNGRGGALPAFNGTHGLPPGKYLVSVTSDGYEIGGAHFSICPTSDDPACATSGAQSSPGLVVVGLNPYPLPLGTIRARAYADILPTTGAWQETDPPLQGFVATIADYDGLVSVDYYGNPLCTEYETTDGKPTSPIKLDAKGTPTPKTPAEYTDGVVPGHCVTGPDGIVTIPNVPPNRYDVTLTPPQSQQGRVDAKASSIGWVQDETLEGNHAIDVWIMPADNGVDTEQVVAGEPVPFVNAGFVPQVNALPAGTMSGGVAVTYGAQSLTDTNATWTVNQWQGDTVVAGDSSAVVASNTATSITLNSGWSVSTPTAGTAYSIAHGGTVSGEVKGQVYGANNYVPGLNGIPGAGGNSGFSGIKLDRPVKLGMAALSNMNIGGDGQTVWAGPTDANGNFDIKNVPDGDYSLAVWDQPQDYALDQFNVTVAHGQVVDVGVLPLLMWFTRLQGHVFVDLNGNGRQDPGEPGVPNFLMQNLNRTNNTYEQGQNTARTDTKGYYEFTEAYPLGQFLTEQFFNTRYKTTGLSYQACNDPQEHTVISPFVDIAYLPIIGQCARVDVGVQPYDASAGDNGGIVATMLYNSIRVNFPARQNIQFDHMTGIPDFRMDLYDAVTGVPNPNNPVNGPPTQRNRDGSFTNSMGFVHNRDGSYRTAQASPLNGNATPVPAQSYITEHAGPPVGCVALDASGKPIDNTQQNSVGVPSGNYQPRCTESSITGVGIGGGTDNQPTFPGGPNHGIQTVDGNYGLDATNSSLCQTDSGGNPIFTNTTGCFQNHTGDFIVHANMPTDNVLGDGHGGYSRPLYTVSNEQDVNVFNGDQWVPQGADTGAVTWPPHADPARQMPVGTYQENPGTYAPGPDPQCAGTAFTVHVTNPDFLAAGGSPFEGQQRNLCDSKLIHVESGQSVAPNFHVHTVVDVPLPGKYSGYIVDDVSASTDRKSTNLGEVSGITGAPIGLYDWANNLQYTTTSDYNGQFEVLMPSTQSSNCLTPAGVCPNVYRLVGNDPGQWPNPNPNYNPVYRTIAAQFQNWPGQFLAADVAPTKAITNLEAAGATFQYPPQCTPAVNAPQVLAVDRPYRNASEGNVTLTISGQGFGATRGSGAVTLDGTSLATTSWSDQLITATVPKSFPAGAHQLRVTNAGGLNSTQGLTYHVLGSGYNPTVLAVGPTKGPNNATAKLALVPSAHRFSSIQAALEYAAGYDFPAFLQSIQNGGTNYPRLRQGPLAQALIIVYPADPLASSPGGAPSSFTPFGTYYENLIVHSPVRVQGVGPGGVRSDGTSVQGTRVDGSYFWSTNALPDVNGEEGGGNLAELAQSNEPYSAAWITLAEAINNVGGEGAGWDGNSNIIEGQVVYVVAKKGAFTATHYDAAMDGFSVSGGDQKDFPGNINEAFGSGSTALQEFGNTDELPGVLQTQGGGFFLNAYADHFHITNNLIQGNSGSYGGAIRVGTPYVNSGAVDDGAGQTNTGVVIANNRIVGNGGTNLAGAIGLFSGSDGYRVSSNILCGNYSLEYGGAISHFGLSGHTGAAGQPSVVGTIDHNQIILNGANDEGGGIMVAGELPLPAGSPAGGGAQFGGGLSPGAGPVVIDSNIIASNIADDDGGGVRFLSGGTAPMLVTNNFITNNDSSHEGGGISIDDTTNITIDHDTIARNITTATATTSDGAPAPAGVSTARNSDLLQNKLPAGAPLYSNPTIVNSIIWDNRAGSWAAGGVAGIGLPNDTTPINVWDVGTVDQSGYLSPTHSLLDVPANQVEGCNGCEAGNPNAEGNYIGADPNFTAPFVTQIDVLQIRTYFRFRPSAIVSISLPANAFGDYRSPYNSPTGGRGAVIPGGLQ